ncbi:DUF461 domain-containing protein [Streptomyces sp. NPDC048290]|uniref:DUF461 domain-containing protein n=1 Tax=Streptomyces sp. NPDC048290 TaxID=3155811 RepID=UPI0034406CF3
MSSSLRRGALAASALAFSIATLAACGAGNNSQTLQIRPDNAATSVGDIKIQNAVVITQPESGASGPAVVSATLFNDGRSAQTLDSINVEGHGDAKISPASGSGPLTVPAGGSVIIGGEGNASAVIADGAGLTDGDAQQVTFTFSSTGQVGLQAFVVPSESFFAGWGPSSVPSASTSPSGSPSSSPSGAAGEEGDEEAGGEASDAPGEEASSAESGASDTPTDAASASASEETPAGH